MKRPHAYLVHLAGALVLGGGIAAWVWPSVPGLLSVAAVCLLPGRLQGFLWRDFFRGRDAMTTGDYAEAVTHFESFGARLNQKPRLAWAIYLAGSAYTWNVRAMLLHNVGSCYLCLGDLGRAATDLRAAAQLDSGYSLPLFNLAVIAHIEGDELAAEELRGRAAAMGFTGGTRDRLLQLAGAVLAAAEGRAFRPEQARLGV